MKNEKNLDFMLQIRDAFKIATDNQESIWGNKNKKVIGGKEMKNDENLDLEREYNWYIQKVVDTGESQGMTTLVKAICEFAADFNGWDDDARHEALDVREKDNESIIDIDGGYPSVTVKRLRNNTYLISCEDVRDDEAYYRDMYGFIEDYIEKIASNKCPVCGEEIVGKGKFCANCGATL